MNNVGERDRAVNWLMQFVQAIMLACILGGGAWWANMIWGTARETQAITNDNRTRLIRLETQSEIRDKTLDRVEGRQQDVLHRLDMIESKQQKP